ncbi:hypothetical protein [Pseudomonas sp. PD9R]|uniref:hypothetical protein n=1 Tax=Pseudomonas sp. PD9R TaxID=2853534 RepID=UPI001C44A94F|nr:hypothetical protein [Pseudomonas sp. PD9R]MBV6827296.1 hypothetical protein [Pseudomonas sp. PD9R]
MSNANNYLGPHKKTGPNSYELGPVSVRAEKLPGLGQGGFFQGVWGLNEGPHRGTSEGSGKLSPLTPFIWDDFMNEQKANNKEVDNEYIGIFNSLAETTNRELEQAKKVAKGTRVLTPIEIAKTDQETTIKAIQSKIAEFQANTDSAH